MSLLDVKAADILEVQHLIYKGRPHPFGCRVPPFTLHLFTLILHPQGHLQLRQNCIQVVGMSGWKPKWWFLYLSWSLFASKRKGHSQQVQRRLSLVSRCCWNPEDGSTLGHGTVQWLVIQHSEIGVLEARGSGNQSCTWVLTEFKASLVYMRPYLKIEKK